MAEKNVEIAQDAGLARPESAREQPPKDEMRLADKPGEEHVSGVLSEIHQKSKGADEDVGPLSMSSAGKASQPKQDGTVVETSRLKDGKDEKEQNSLEEEMKDRVPNAELLGSPPHVEA